MVAISDLFLMKPAKGKTRQKASLSMAVRRCHDYDESFTVPLQSVQFEDKV